MGLASSPPVAPVDDTSHTENADEFLEAAMYITDSNDTLNLVKAVLALEKASGSKNEDEQMPCAVWSHVAGVG